MLTAFHLPENRHIIYDKNILHYWKKPPNKSSKYIQLWIWHVIFDSLDILNSYFQMMMHRRWKNQWNLLQKCWMQEVHQLLPYELLESFYNNKCSHFGEYFYMVYETKLQMMISQFYIWESFFLNKERASVRKTVNSICCLGLKIVLRYFLHLNNADLAEVSILLMFS